MERNTMMLAQWNHSRDGDPKALALFRRSSDLIRSAMALAWQRWPGERLYTYVNPRFVKSANPGYCFLMAGWHRCGKTKSRELLILEALPK